MGSRDIIKIRPAPLTCCPERNIKKGICLGCGVKEV